MWSFYFSFFLEFLWDFWWIYVLRVWVGILRGFSRGSLVGSLWPYSLWIYPLQETQGFGLTSKFSHWFSIPHESMKLGTWDSHFYLPLRYWIKVPNLESIHCASREIISIEVVVFLQVPARGPPTDSGFFTVSTDRINRRFLCFE